MVSKTFYQLTDRKADVANVETFNECVEEGTASVTCSPSNQSPFTVSSPSSNPPSYMSSSPSYASLDMSKKTR
jgi:hypothetical protein